MTVSVALVAHEVKQKEVKKRFLQTDTRSPNKMEQNAFVGGGVVVVGGAEGQKGHSCGPPLRRPHERDAKSRARSNNMLVAKEQCFLYPSPLDYKEL